MCVCVCVCVCVFRYMQSPTSPQPCNWLECRERDAAWQRHSEAAEALSARLADLDAENRALREAKASLDARASELACRLGVAEGAARALEDESSHLRGVASAAARDRADRDAEAADLRARLRSAEDKVGFRV